MASSSSAGSRTASEAALEPGELVQPPHLLSHGPLPSPGKAVLGCQQANAVPLAMHELALVAPAVRPVEDAVPAFEVVHVLSHVSATVGKHEAALAVHLIPPPLALVLAPVAPGVCALSVEGILPELAIVLAALLVPPEGEHPVPVLGAVLILTIETGAVGQYQAAVALLLASFPLASVGRAVVQGADAEAVGLVVHPGAHVDAAVGVLEGAEALGPAALELAVVPASIGPDLDALAVGLLADPLACVLYAVVKDYLTSGLAALLVGHNHLLQRQRARVIALAGRRCTLIHRNGGLGLLQKSRHP
eukprot:CAMPEP_0197908912 /NCGR_PEP_ID=MMETSP1439-20131203/67778_1 /TAXON_ID=66791 /ORGANISM="Gonyaulax spinifera, Strain CCMP409" /LENGTH=304 /DNA_ID=CAMNT_0043530445 /DNA_START=286 /DNA_END=1196 /DNA_ORIENTATION=+